MMDCVLLRAGLRDEVLWTNAPSLVDVATNASAQAEASQNRE